MHVPILAALATFLQLSNAIIGGTAADSNLFLSEVSLQTTSHICGAVLVSRTQILTHPSCVQGQTATSLKARVGSRWHNTGGKLFPISGIEIHSQYTPSGPGRLLNGIALLTLRGHVTPDDAKRARLPRLGVISPAPAPGTVLNIAGWGVTLAGSSSIPKVLQRTAIDVITSQRCSEAYPDLSFNRRVFCAARGSRSSSCAKHAGGPVVDAETGILVGIIGLRVDDTCAQSGHPDVYTNLNDYSMWLLRRLLLRLPAEVEGRGS